MTTQLRNQCRWRAWEEWAIIGIFVITMLLPSVGYVMGYSGRRHIRVLEKRRAAPPPSPPTSLTGWATVPSAISKWWDDSFGFRSNLAAANNYVLYRLGTSSSPHVVVGKKDWLYLRSNNNLLKQNRGLTPLSDTAVEAWGETMRERHSWLERKGIVFVAAVVPEKPDRRLPRRV